MFKKIFRKLALVVVIALIPATLLAGQPNLRENLAKLTKIKEPYSFAVIGDNRSGDKIYNKIIAGVLARNPIFAVNTGDVIPNPGNRNQWKNFWEMSKVITVPYFLTPGNHDIDDKKSEAVWRDEVDFPGKETYYSFAAGKDLYVILNCYEQNEEHKIAGEQFEWLKHTLDPKRYEHQFVFVHEPPFLWKGASHYGESLDRYPEFRDRLHNLFKERRVDVVFLGHEHTYDRREVDGVNYIIVGGAGAPLYNRDTFNHFTIITVDGKRIEGKTIDRDGVMRDEFVLQHREQ